MQIRGACIFCVRSVENGRTENPVRHLRKVPFQVKVSPKQYPLQVGGWHYHSHKSVGGTLMAASQVVLYFANPEDALLFTLAASSVIGDEGPIATKAVKVAEEICKATRITTEGVLEPASAPQANVA